MHQLNIVLKAMLKIGFVGFGGGSSLIPVIEKEIVEDHAFLSKEEFDEEVIVASITPGALPVEIACGIGKKCFERLGMILTTISIACPGVIMCVTLLALLNSMSESFLDHITWYSFGINMLIVYMLLEFVGKIIQESKQRGRIKQDCILCALVCILTGGSKIASFLHINLPIQWDVSIVGVLFLTFFYILFVKTQKSKKRTGIAWILGLLFFIFQILKKQNMGSMFLLIVEGIMVVLAIYGVYGDLKTTKSQYTFRLKDFFQDEIAWGGFLLIFSLPALFFCPNTLIYIGKGIISSFLSYGGGDAYLSIANGIFVESQLISEADFYGKLVCVANVLPGSILCKVLSGIGFYIGLETGNSFFDGICMALSGFAVSVFGSVSTFLLARYIFKSYEELKCFKILKVWSRPIIGGLLIPVAVSLASQSIEVPVQIGYSGITCYIYAIILILSAVGFSKIKKLSFLAKVFFMALIGRILIFI